MTVVEAIYARRAVRSYTRERVAKDDLQALLRAAVQAPSAMNGQPWIFAVIEDRHRLARWSELAKSMVLRDLQRQSDPKATRYLATLQRADYDVFHGAPALIVIGAAERGRYTDADVWLAAQNLMLAACDADLGTCPIGFAIPLLDTPEIKAEMGFPPASAVVAAIVVGRPAGKSEPVARFEPRVLGWL